MKTAIELARMAGFQTGTRDYADGEGGHPFVAPIASGTCLPEIERLVELVRLEMREACAKAVDEIEARSIAKDVDDPPLAHVSAAIREVPITPA